MATWSIRDGRKRKASGLAKAGVKKTEHSVSGAPEVGGLPRTFQDESRLLPLNDPRSPMTERYRRLKTHVEHLGESHGHDVRTLVVSSSREGEGKTLTSMNLSLVLAEERELSVILVDCDLHRPQLHRMFRNPPRIGLMDIYEGRAELASAVVPLVNSRLHILPAGSIKEVNTLEVFRSTRFREILNSMKERYDRVVLDTPPIMRFVDANILNEISDGMIFVVRAGLTAKQMVQRAVASVTSGHIIGLVLNDVRYSVVDRYYYRYDEYGKSYYDD